MKQLSTFKKEFLTKSIQMEGHIMRNILLLFFLFALNGKVFAQEITFFATSGASYSADGTLIALGGEVLTDPYCDKLSDSENPTNYVRECWRQGAYIEYSLTGTADNAGSYVFDYRACSAHGDGIVKGSISSNGGSTFTTIDSINVRTGG